MSADVVVTCPQWFWEDWIDEGALPDEPLPDDTEYGFSLGGPRPDIQPGERVYIVALGKVRGYAPLVRVQADGPGRFSLVRQGGAAAVTIPEPVRGFRGWRYRWWERDVETPFPNWKQP